MIVPGTVFFIAESDIYHCRLPTEVMIIRISGKVCSPALSVGEQIREMIIHRMVRYMAG